MSSTKDIKSIYPNTVEKFLNEPNWKVVKRAQEPSTRYGEERIGRLLEEIELNMPFRKARSLKRQLNHKRTEDEKRLFYFRQERMDKEGTRW